MSRKKKFQSLQAPKGMHDVLPNEQQYWERVRGVVSKFSDFYGFGRIDTPILENTLLFERGVGDATDIVEKEMFTLKTKGGDSLTLRPEGTAPVIRAYIENGLSNLSHPLKLYYIGSMFRHENPQAGRFRQFHQFGYEIIGSKEPILDAQLIQLFFVMADELGLKELSIQINSIGDNECRPAYKSTLKDFLRSNVRKLCPNCKKRFRHNPLRVLDCKNDKCAQIARNAPQIIDHLCKECHNHFKNVLEFLDELDLPYTLNPLLVRGLDYYTKTVFEVVSDDDSLKSLGTLAAGGRYDDLVEYLGGKSTPAVGFSAGVERLIAVMKEQKVKLPIDKRPKIFLAQLGDLARKKSLMLFEDLRKAGIFVMEAFGKGSIKSQLKQADRQAVKIALILGQKEAFDGNIICRDMESGVQEIIPLSKIIPEVKKRLRK